MNLLSPQRRCGALLGRAYLEEIANADLIPYYYICAPCGTDAFRRDGSCRPRHAGIRRSGATRTDRLEALGTLRARESVVLTASVTETVTRIHFDDGDRVNAGQVLVKMTSAEEHAQLEEAKSQYERIKPLAAEGTAAKSLLDERQREWETARARYAAIISRLDDRLIRAPFAGVVGLRNISVGALVGPGDVITTLDDLSEMKLDFSVPTTFLQTLRPDLAIIASTHAYPERRFEGIVKSIDSRIDPITRTVMVRAVLSNPDAVLKPG